MSDFIRVLGQDPNYKPLKSFLYIHRHSIVKAYPVYAEVVNGQAFRCTPDHPKAQLISYMLIDQRGEEYSCGHDEELQKLGLQIKGEEKRRIGFIVGENKEKVAIDSEERAGESEDGGTK